MLRVTKGGARALQLTLEGTEVRACKPRAARALKLTPSPMSEHHEQVSLFQRMKQATGQYPELALAFAIPNGGFRNVTTGARMKAEGVRRSVPDLMIPTSRGRWYGLFVELKKIGEYATVEQKAYHALLREQGYAVYVCQGWVKAWEVIETYLSEGRL
jgi:hypothetical protein